jgi:hypothetical protein
MLVAVAKSCSTASNGLDTRTIQNGKMHLISRIVRTRCVTFICSILPVPGLRKGWRGGYNVGRMTAIRTIILMITRLCNWIRNLLETKSCWHDRVSGSGYFQLHLFFPTPNQCLSQNRLDAVAGAFDLMVGFGSLIATESKFTPVVWLCGCTVLLPSALRHLKTGITDQLGIN